MTQSKEILIRLEATQEQIDYSLPLLALVFDLNNSHISNRGVLDPENKKYYFRGNIRDLKVAKLWTVERELVGEFWIPDFELPPKILLWGDGAFLNLSNEVDGIQWEYLEASTYVLRPHLRKN